MDSGATLQQKDNQSSLNARVRRRMIQILVGIVAQAIVLFVAAGRLDWTAAWVQIAIYTGVIVFNWIVIVPRNPELIAERGEINKEGTKSWDKSLSMFASVIMPLVMLLVAGLDERFNWSPVFHPAVQFAGAVVLLLGISFTSWAMISNAFFSATVRIQTDRGHKVATGGPYHYVRHPGYVGMIIFTLGIPFLLGSLWALIPAVIVTVLFILRTALEDRTLHAELEGYTEYAQQTRYRLLPGVW